MPLIKIDWEDAERNFESYLEQVIEQGKSFIIPEKGVVIVPFDEYESLKENYKQVVE